MGRGFWSGLLLILILRILNMAMADKQPVIRSKSFQEKLAVDAYEKAITDALSSADSGAEKIVTAAFSIATAYGALIAIVSPKEETGALILAVPFAGFLVAAITAMIARTRGIDVDITNRITEVEKGLKKAISRKRFWTWTAVVSMLVTIGTAGLIIVDTYGGAPTNPPVVSVWLTSEGRVHIAEVCGLDAVQTVSGEHVAGSLEGDKNTSITVKVTKGSCGTVEKLTIPLSMVITVTQP